MRDGALIGVLGLLESYPAVVSIVASLALVLWLDARRPSTDPPRCPSPGVTVRRFSLRRR